MFGLVRNIDFSVAAMIIGIVLLITSYRKYRSVSKANRSFVLSCVFLIVSCSLEIVTAITRTYPYLMPAMLQHIIRSVYSVANGVLATYVYRYARSYSESFDKKRSWSDYAALFSGSLYILISIINVPTGIVFHYEKDGTYVHGPLYAVTFAGVAVILFFAFISTIGDKKYYTHSQFVTVNFLYFITAISSALEVIIDSKALVIMFGIAVGLLIVFMSLESPDYARAVAAREEAEAARIEADRANSAKSDFLARMSHEIRTPMNAIMGMNEMIIHSTKEEQSKAYSCDAYNAAHNLLDIINEILDFSRIESGKLTLNNDKYSLTALLRDLWALFKIKASEKGLTISFDIDPELNDFRIGDSVRLRQILVNLLNNALKYTDEGSITLKVSLLDRSEKGDVVKYEVTDTGRGIKDEDIHKLFEAFARIEENKSQNIVGTGLGVNIATSLLKLMDSHLEVASEYGKGSTFFFVLRQEVIGQEKTGQYDKGADEVAVSYEDISVASGRILCVDDTPLNLKVFRAFLKDSRLDIDVAQSAIDALTLTKKEKYDLIFMDHLMPEIDGPTCFAMIKEQEDGLNRDTPEIVLTANAIKGAKEKYEELGFIDVCFKPYTKDEITRLINNYLS